MPHRRQGVIAPMPGFINNRIGLFDQLLRAIQPIVALSLTFNLPTPFGSAPYQKPAHCYVCGPRSFAAFLFCQ